MNNKLTSLNKYLEKVDGVLLFSNINRKWFLNFDSSFGYVLINKNNEVIYITDSRYFSAAKEFLNSKKNILVWCITADVTLKELLMKAKTQLKIDSILIEEEYINLQQLTLLNSIFNKMIPFVSKNIRSVKEEWEIEFLQKAADIIVDVLQWVKSFIKPGYSEKEIAKLISIKILELGASGNSFDPIVAAGLNTANPHHKPSDYKIKDGDFIYIDLGAVYNGYASDMTRTFVIGKEANNKEMIKIFDLVLKSQVKGVKSASNKITGEELDKVCRDIIDETEYKGLFCHSTGHGVGLEVHELPNVNNSNKNVFENYNVITIEPGIYKEKVGGVRIEDTIIVYNNNCIVLTRHSLKKLEYIVNE